MTPIEEYYNKFNEDKRLTRRHGQVEYVISMDYIHQYLEKLKSEMETSQKSEIHILDIGAGTGRYSVALAEEGYDVTAIELVKANLGQLKKKNSCVKAYQGNALNLKRFSDESFDLTLLFGPMYHLVTGEDRLQALKEAKRVTRKGGIIMVAYLMNDYGVLIYGFRDKNVKACLEDGRLTEDFHCQPVNEDFYAYLRVEDINQLNNEAGLVREIIFAPDGAANYMRAELKEMDEETFQLFIKYQKSVCERQDLLGASAHTVDILRK